MDRNIPPLSIVLFLSAFRVAASQDLADTALGPGDSTLHGRTVAPVQAAPIRDEPPHGYLMFPGRKRADTAQQACYVIEDSMKLQFLFSDQVWVLIRKCDGEEPLGWVYWGDTVELENSVNFELSAHPTD